MAVKQDTFIDNAAPQLCADWLNSSKSESNNAIVASGQTLNDGDLFQLSKAVKSFVNSSNFYTDGGAADAYTLTTLAPYQASISYTDGLLVRTRMGNSNTGISTVNVDGVGVKTIKKDDGAGSLVDLVAGDVISGQDIFLQYNLAADFFVLFPITGGGGAAVVSEIFHIQHLLPNGTDGGTFTSGAWRTRVLNTVVQNDVVGASLSANQFTLPIGVYRIRAKSIIGFVNEAKSKLVNITDGTDQIIGDTSFSASNWFNHSVDGEFTLLAPKAFEIQHRSNISRATTGFGNAASFGVDEIYCNVIIERIG